MYSQAILSNPIKPLPNHPPLSSPPQPSSSLHRFKNTRLTSYHRVFNARLTFSIRTVFLKSSNSLQPISLIFETIATVYTVRHLFDIYRWRSRAFSLQIFQLGFLISSAQTWRVGERDGVWGGGLIDMVQIIFIFMLIICFRKNKYFKKGFG